MQSQRQSKRTQPKPKAKMAGGDTITTASSAKKKWTNNAMKDEIVAAINRYRSYHKVNPLVRNTKIERDHSDRWAKEICQTDNFTHSDDEKYGENIYAGELTNGLDPVDIWYFECEFDYNDPERSLMGPGCGHFTAMVWKETQEVGVGIHSYDDAEGIYVVVASFYPPGNLIGSVAKNVIKPRNKVRRRHKPT